MKSKRVIPLLLIVVAFNAIGAQKINRVGDVETIGITSSSISNGTLTQVNDTSDTENQIDDNKARIAAIKLNVNNLDALMQVCLSKPSYNYTRTSGYYDYTYRVTYSWDSPNCVTNQTLISKKNNAAAMCVARGSFTRTQSAGGGCTSNHTSDTRTTYTTYAYYWNTSTNTCSTRVVRSYTKIRSVRDESCYHNSHDSDHDHGHRYR
ncbi:hypothetical protein HUO09_17885 [Vibrio sp. Y2-5]|uniref:hypothetical protein n=1 Tax=Vibrio sp. Y2-5 TaxID=2743977 RepID=UPI0016614163|nr:hypothetical protein [Vibrio sp. Y2-5]MBD0788230.1 hypothetical protein [Vibrio sp. Y2-5]